ncbi:hypothetical protein NW939_12815 [Aeromonas caviae]|uniref:hypothetical protein n=1 Tax=Aeromonas caviae TaxID=648 RepID=UPI0021C9B819|nr:hypothetical protein [Aeromonas caviae]MCR9025493.1 hypothetical protein [Aeromonas caviae]
MHTATIAGTSIVLLGSFNPDVFTVGWLLHHELIGEDSVDSSNPGINIPFEVARINLKDCWVVVEKNKLVISTTSSPYTFISDLAVNILILIGPSCVVEKIGFNYEEHYMFTPQEREDIGLALAPRAVWGDWGKALHNSDLSNPQNGLRTMTMKQSELYDRVDGSINVTVGVSERVTNGVGFKYNDHFDLFEDNDTESNLTQSSKGKRKPKKKGVELPEVNGYKDAIALINEKYLLSVENSKVIFSGVIGASLNV